MVPRYILRKAILAFHHTLLHFGDILGSALSTFPKDPKYLPPNLPRHSLMKMCPSFPCYWAIHFKTAL